MGHSWLFSQPVRFGQGDGQVFANNFGLQGPGSRDKGVSRDGVPDNSEYIKLWIWSRLEKDLDGRDNIGVCWEMSLLAREEQLL